MWLPRSTRCSYLGAAKLRRRHSRASEPGLRRRATTLARPTAEALGRGRIRLTVDGQRDQQSQKKKKKKQLRYLRRRLWLLPRHLPVQYGFQFTAIHGCVFRAGRRPRPLLRQENVPQAYVLPPLHRHVVGTYRPGLCVRSLQLCCS